jgi:hypothetical protein
MRMMFLWADGTESLLSVVKQYSPTVPTSLHREMGGVVGTIAGEMEISFVDVLLPTARTVHQYLSPPSSPLSSPSLEFMAVMFLFLLLLLSACTVLPYTTAEHSTNCPVSSTSWGTDD